MKGNISFWEVMSRRVILTVIVRKKKSLFFFLKGIIGQIPNSENYCISFMCEFPCTTTTLHFCSSSPPNEKHTAIRTFFF